jgi:hypothetical protein
MRPDNEWSRRSKKSWRTSQEVSDEVAALFTEFLLQLAADSGSSIVVGDDPAEARRIASQLTPFADVELA